MYPLINLVALIVIKFLSLPAVSGFNARVEKDCGEEAMGMRAVFLLFLANVLLMPAGAYANSGNVSQLSGTLSVTKANGSVRILSRQSQIESGDTINTQQGSYAQVKFSDGGQITLKPNTTVKIERFSFVDAEPKKDSFFYSLVKGGLRAVSGLVGKRGDPDSYQMNTETATIGIRGTSFGADDCTGPPASDGPCKGLEPAVYVSVTDGEIVATNNAGSVSFLAGQFGLIDSRDRRPRYLSTDPGLQFAPPATFIASISGGSAVNQGRSLECVVRP